METILYYLTIWYILGNINIYIYADHNIYSVKKKICLWFPYLLLGGIRDGGGSDHDCGGVCFVARLLSDADLLLVLR